ncbi:MAG: polysaccharide deacetylase family protein [Bacillota bacterium]|nr:polysaccharide deacetylase family protein [Bacillota bacterium]
MRFIFIPRKKAGSLLSGFLLLLFAALPAALLFSPAALQAMGQESRLLPIYKVDTEKPLVGISFDASWGAEHSPEILDTLDEYGVKASFFLVNIWVEDYPELAREIAARGHEIGLHSVSHPHFSSLSPEEIRAELQENFALIQETTGYCPTLFRPPFGDYNEQVISQVLDCGFDCIQWSKDSLDWKDLSAEVICQRVLKDIHAGDILLFHNNGLHTAEALPLVLEGLAELGLQAAPVGEILLEGDCYVDSQGVQRRRHP